MTDDTHSQRYCKVTQATKNKFSCLSNTCLEHSWTCEDHREENTPLLAAHLKELSTLYPSLMKPVQRKRKPKDPDPSLFLFCSIPGRYRAANVFFDTGNPHCLFTTGTPQNLCGIRVKRGPRSLGTTEGAFVIGGDTWACEVLNTEGNKELLVGVEVPRISADFPLVDL